MASPQIENGYTKIANEIIEKLSYANLNGSELRIIILVIRKTYGFNKVEDRISLTQFERGTGLKRANVCDTLKSLVVVKRLLLKRNNLYRFNKNWNEWVVAKRLLGGSQKHNQVVAKRLHTKESIQKKVIYMSDKATPNPPSIVDNTQKEEEPSREKEVSEIITFYSERIRPHKITPQLRSKAANCLKSFSKEDILWAIHRKSEEKWWMDNNSHRGATWFFSNKSRIQRYLGERE